MRKNLEMPIEQAIQKAKSKGLRRRVLALLSVFVLLVTTNQLIFAADTLERIATCALAEHQHSDECYNSEGELICDLPEHVHTDACYQERPKKDVEKAEEEEPEEEIPEELEEFELSEEEDTEAEAEVETESSEVVEAADYRYTVGEQSPVYLTDILAAVGLTVDGKVTASQVLDGAHPDGMIRVVNDEAGVAIYPTQDFSDAELAVFAGNEIYTITLLDAVVPEVEVQAESEPVVEEEITETEEVESETETPDVELNDLTTENELNEEKQTSVGDEIAAEEQTEVVIDENEPETEPVFEEAGNEDEMPTEQLPYDEIVESEPDADASDNEIADAPEQADDSQEEVEQIVVEPAIDENIDPEDSGDDVSDSSEAETQAPADDSATDKKFFEATYDLADLEAPFSLVKWVSDAANDETESVAFDIKEWNVVYDADVLSVEMTDEDWSVMPLGDFEETGLSVDTGDAIYNLKLQNWTAPVEEEAELPEVDASVYTAQIDLAGLEAPFSLADWLSQAMAANAVDEIAPADEWEPEYDNATFTLRADSEDYVVIPQMPFEQADFAVNAGEVRYELTLVNYGVEAEPELLDGEVFEVPVDGADYTLKISVPASAELEEGTYFTAKVENGANYADAALNAVDSDGECMVLATFDLTVYNKDGSVATPKDALDVSVQFNEALTDVSSVYVVHFPGTGEQPVAEPEPALMLKSSLLRSRSTMMLQSSGLEIEEEAVPGEDIKTELISATNDGNSVVSFQADSFSVYAVVGTIETFVITADGETYKITVSYGSNSGIPENAELVASEIVDSDAAFEGYVGKAAEALKEDEYAPIVNAARLFDIAIMADGEKIEPKAPVDVKIEYVNPEGLSATSEVNAVHFKESEENAEDVVAEVLDIDVQDGEANMQGVSFKTDSFSIYAVVFIDKEEGSFVFEDENYRVTVSYTKEANIPFGTKLTVSEIEYDSDEYWDLWNQTVEKLNEGVELGNELEPDPRVGLTSAAFFDITLNYNGEEFEPEVPLGVKIEYLNGCGIMTPTEEENGVIHFGKDTVELIDGEYAEEDGAAVSFEYMQDSFSPVGTYSTGIYSDPNLPEVSLPGSLRAVKAVNRDGEVGAMVASKNLDPNDDGTYTLKIKLTGQAQSGSSQSITKSNVVIVVDVSGSMDEDVTRFVYNESAEVAYNNTSNQQTIGGRTYKSGTAYYTGATGNTRVYPTLQNGVYRWATYSNYSGWSNYTGTVYTGGDRLAATKIALYNLVDALLANNKNETITDADGKVISLSDTIEITLIQFANKNSNYYGSTYNDTRTLIRNAVTAGSVTTSNSLKGRINALTASGGTNWEAALQEALTEANRYKNASTTGHAGTEADPITTMEGETTSVIFFTDGMPSFYGNDNGTGSDGSRDNVHNSWNGANDDARALVTNGFTVYNIFAYGAASTGFNNDPGTTNANLTPSDYLKSLTNYEYGHSNNFGSNAQYRDNATSTYTSNYFFDASNTEKLQQAFEKIIGNIQNLVAFGGVDVHDGVNFGATNSTVLLNDGTIDPQSFTYTVSDGTTVEYKVRVDESGVPIFTIGTGASAQSYPGTTTTVQVPDPTAPNDRTVPCEVYSVTVGTGDDAKTYTMCPASLYTETDGDRQGIEWDLTGMGTLEGGKSYELSFIVWPNQDAYDLIAMLNNGDITMEEALARDEYKEIAKYIDGNKEDGYTLSTNWEQNVNYYKVDKVVEDDGEPTYTYTQQPPVNLSPGTATLASTKMNMVKHWDDSLDDAQLQEILWGKDFDTDPVSTKYKVDLYIWKAETPEALAAMVEENDVNNAEKHIELGWDEGKEGDDKYVWNKDYTVSPGVMVKEGDTAAVNLGLTHAHHDGYDEVYYDATDDGEDNGSYYFILEPGHYYTVSEADVERHFELNTFVYHPMVVNGVMSNVAFNEDGTVTVTEMTSVDAHNTLKGGINILKRAFDGDDEISVTGDRFRIKVTLTNENGTPYTDFDYRIYYGENNPNYADTDKYPKHRTGHIYGTTKPEDNTTEFTDDLEPGESLHTILGNEDGIIELDYYIGDTVRIVNVPAGVIYAVEETKINDEEINDSYYAHTATIYEISEGESENYVADDREVHSVKGNSASQVTVKNEVPSTKVKIKKIGDENGNNKLEGVVFNLYADYVDGEYVHQLLADSLGAEKGLAYGENGAITTDSDGMADLGTLIAGTYYLKETDLGSNTNYALNDNPIEIVVTEESFQITGVTANGSQVYGEVTGTGTDDDPYVITVNNVRDTAPLKVEKTVVGIDDGSEFQFTVVIEDAELEPEGPDGVEPTVDGKKYTYSGIKLKKDDFAEFTAVPLGSKVTVTETATTEYTATYAVTPEPDGTTVEGSASFTFAAEAIKDLGEDDVLTVTVTNTRKTGDLELSKVLVSDRAADAKQVFTFTVTLSDNTVTGTYGNMTFANGEATVTLKGGESATATGLPGGLTYTITEAAAEGFQLTGKTGDTGTISTTASTATFTNTRETGDLKLSKVLVSDLAVDKNVEFEFTVTLGDTSINGTYGDMTFANGVATVKLKGGQSATATGLPTTVTYSITEKAADGFSTTYDSNSGAISATLSTSTYTNTRVKGGLVLNKTVVSDRAAQIVDMVALI